jgi:hypothetical protein
LSLHIKQIPCLDDATACTAFRRVSPGFCPPIVHRDAGPIGSSTARAATCSSTTRASCWLTRSGPSWFAAALQSLAMRRRCRGRRVDSGPTGHLVRGGGAIRDVDGVVALAGSDGVGAQRGVGIEHVVAGPPSAVVAAVRSVSSHAKRSLPGPPVMVTDEVQSTSRSLLPPPLRITVPGPRAR